MKIQKWQKHNLIIVVIKMKILNKQIAMKKSKIIKKK